MKWGVKFFFSCCCILQRRVKSLRCMMQRGVKSMIVAEIFPLDDANQMQIKSSYWFLQRGDVTHCCTLKWESDLTAAKCSRKSNLTAVWCSGESNLTSTWHSGESNLTAACYSGESIWQQGVKSDNFGRLPRPLKRQSCKKITYETPSLSYSYENLFLKHKMIMYLKEREDKEVPWESQ